MPLAAQIWEHRGSKGGDIKLDQVLTTWRGLKYQAPSEAMAIVA